MRLIKSHSYCIRKLKRILCIATLPIIYFIVLLCFRTISFKIGVLSNKGRITQFTTYIEPELRINKNKSKFIFINPGKVNNKELYYMYKRYACIYNKDQYFKFQIFHLIFKILNYLKYNNVVHLGLYPERHSFAWNGCPPTISFSKNDLEIGRKTLSKMAIKDQDYVCLGIREPAYYKTLDSGLSPEASEEYSIRNPDIKNYAEMAQSLIELGYKVVKVGSVSDLDIKNNLPEAVIDYTSLYRTEFNDIFMHGNAKFIIAGGSGNWCLGSIFNKPIISTDYYMLNARCLREEDLFIPVKYWSEKLNRFLKYSEIIEFYDYFKTKNLAEKNHIRIVHNTPKEIAQVALEMHQRLKGEWITTQEDLELQSEFNKIFDKGNSHFTSKYCPSRIGALFLRENLSLL
jgi:putative glycosyltransferase (TIGR04372 family)